MNLASRTLSNEKYEVLSYGLNHRLATNQNKSDVKKMKNTCFFLLAVVSLFPNNP